jgi:hypothetical protein
MLYDPVIPFLEIPTKNYMPIGPKQMCRNIHSGIIYTLNS